MNKKLLTLFSIVAAMSLVACGGNKESQKSAEPSAPESQPASQPESEPASEPESQPAPSSSKDSTPAPQSSSQGGGQQETSSSQGGQTPEASVLVSSTDVVAKNGKVYLQIAGTASNIAAANFKWAFSLQHIGVESLDPLETYILGGAEFADADYNITVNLGADGAYTFEYNLSDIQGMAPGMYKITAGPKGNLVSIGTETGGASVKDGSFRYYLRHDEQVGNVNTIVVDALPPISFEEATVTKIGAKTYAKIGGALKAGITQETLDGYDSFVNFQQVGGSWSNTRRNKANKQYYYKVEQEGAKAYLYADISFFAAGSNYNTHLNVTENTQADCKMDVAIDQHYLYVNTNGVLLDINVYANPNASSSDMNEFWGNLGFKVTAAAEGAVEGPVEEDPNAGHIHNFTTIEHAKGEGEVTETIKKCDDPIHGEYYEIAWSALDEARVTTEGGMGTSGNNKGKLNKAGAAEEYKFYSPEALTARLYPKMGYNSSALYNRANGPSDSACNSVYYDWKESEKGWKMDVEVNGMLIDQASQKIEVGTQEVAMDQLMYADFVDTVDGNVAEFPWVEVKLKQGINTVKITRIKGYSVLFDTIQFKGVKRTVEKSLEYMPKSAKVADVEGKATLNMDFAYEGYTAEEINAITPKLDFQFVGGTWAKVVQEATLTSVSDGIARFAVDLDHLDFNTYLTHLDISGKATGDAPDFKLPESFEDVYKIGGKKITLRSVQGSTAQAGYWGCLGFIIEDATAKVFHYLDAEARLVDGKACLVIKGDYENYTKDEMEALPAIFDIEVNAAHSKHNPENTQTGRAVIEGAQVVAKDDGTFEMIVDITAINWGTYWTHTGIGGDAGDVKLAKAVDSSVTVGNKKYQVYCNPQGQSNETFWGNVALVIEHVHVFEADGAAVDGTQAIKCACGEASGYEVALSTATFSNGGISSGKVTNGSVFSLTFKMPATAAGTYSLQLFGKMNSVGHDNAFSNGEEGKGSYAISADEVAGTVTCGGKQIGATFGATPTDGVYFEMGQVTITEEQLADGQVVITITFPQTQDYRHVYSENVRLIKIA